MKVQTKFKILFNTKKLVLSVYKIETSKNKNMWVNKFFTDRIGPCIRSTIEGSISILFKLN